MADQAEKLRFLSQKQQQSTSRIYAVTSGKGGVGKTNLSVNLGICLSELGGQVMILDADLGMANVDVLLGVTPKYSLQHVLAGKVSLAEILVTGPNGIRIIPGVSGALGLTDLSKSQRDRFLEELHQLELALQTDYIIIDTSAGMSETVLNFLFAADEIILVTTPEPTAMMDAYAIIKNVLKKQPDCTIKVIVNMVKNKKETETVFNTLNVITKKFLNYQLQLLGGVFRDENVFGSVKAQKPFVLNQPYCAASISVKKIANDLASVKPRVTSLKGIRRLFEKAFVLSRV